MARHWRCDLHWFAGGHVAQVGRGDAFRAVLDKLSALDLTPVTAPVIASAIAPAIAPVTATVTGR
jgi:hypothetical protein